MLLIQDQYCATGHKFSFLICGTANVASGVVHELYNRRICDSLVSKRNINFSLQKFLKHMMQILIPELIKH
jgi:hypothetical protein